MCVFKQQTVLLCVYSHELVIVCARLGRVFFFALFCVCFFHYGSILLRWSVFSLSLLEFNFTNANLTQGKWKMQNMDARLTSYRIWLVFFSFSYGSLIKKRNHNRTRSTSDSKVKLVNNNVKCNQNERTVDAIVNIAGKGQVFFLYKWWTHLWAQFTSLWVVHRLVTYFSVNNWTLGSDSSTLDRVRLYPCMRPPQTNRSPRPQSTDRILIDRLSQSSIASDISSGDKTILRKSRQNPSSSLGIGILWQVKNFFVSISKFKKTSKKTSYTYQKTDPWSIVTMYSHINSPMDQRKSDPNQAVVIEQ